MANSCESKKVLHKFISSHNLKDQKLSLISCIPVSDIKDSQNIFYRTTINESEPVKMLISKNVFTNETEGTNSNLLVNYNKKFGIINFRIFLLGSLISSVQVFQYSKELREEDLKLLIKFLNFTKSEKFKGKRPKHLFFIISEWNNPEIYSYGIEGGQKYLENLLSKIEEDKRTNYKILLSEHFDSIGCSLIPNLDNSNLSDDKFRENTLIYTKICQETKNCIIQSIQDSKAFLNGYEFLSYLNTLNQNLEIYKYIEVVSNDLDTKNKSCENQGKLLKNNSPKCYKTNDRYELNECSYNNSKRLKIKDDGKCNDPNKSKELKDCSENEFSSDEEPEKSQDEENCARCYRGPTMTASTRTRKLPTKNERKVENKLYRRGESLNSLKDINDAVLDIQNGNEFNFENSQFSSEQNCILEIPDDVLIKIMLYLRNEDIVNLLFTSPLFVNRFAVSRTILRLININIDKENYNKFFKYFSIHYLPFVNLSLNFKDVSTVKKFLPFLKLLSSSVENLEIKNANFKNFNEFLEFYNCLPNLKKTDLENCKIAKIDTEKLPTFLNLFKISFHKCNDNIFKAFVDQKFLKKITVRNNNLTWSGFPHDTFNLMAKNAENLHQIVLIGPGTGSFFDSDQFSFKVRVLDTTMISFHWYVGIRNGRITFLQSQKGYLKELTIHQLPFDFDGDKVLKYIIEDMKLEKFFLGKTPLILDGQKQLVERFEASEIQIQSIFEMFRQFPTITSFCLNINETDIASDAIEAVINPSTNLFDGLQEFEVNDNSKDRSIFGVFLGLVKNFRNIRRLILKTQDRNINTLLGEFLPIMTQLIEIYLPSTAPRMTERFHIIRSFVPNLSKISVASQFIKEAREIFGPNVNVIAIL